MSEKEHIEDVPHGSAKEQEVLDALQGSFLDGHFDSSWRPAKVQYIVNDTLSTEYEEKKQDFLVRGRKPEELNERYGFFVENNVAILEFITRLGLQSRDSEYNALGYNRMGVYLCKHSDVCLQHALVKHSGSLVMRMVMCKYISGRSTTAIPRVASASEFIEPTQGFDSHESVINPDPRDSLQNKFDRSQVYVYEINKLLQPCSRPRQVLPFAVVSFTQNGAYLPAIDAEATPAERMASTLAQQNIANIINSKETLAAQPGSSPASAPTVQTVVAAPGPGLMSGPPVAGSPPQIPAGSIGPTVPPSLQVQTSAPSSIGPSLVTSPAVHNGVNGDQSPSPGNSEDSNKDPLRNVVSQLNVKLGSELKRPESVHMVANSVAPHPPTPVASASHYTSVHQTLPHAAANFPRVMHLPAHMNGLPPGLVPAHSLQGVMPGGTMALPPGLIPAGLLPGQQGVIPGQPGLLPNPHHHMMLPMGAPSQVKPGLQLIPGMPGAGLMGAMPNMIPGVPANAAALQGTIQGALPGTLHGAFPGTLQGAIQGFQGIHGIPGSLAGSFPPTRSSSVNTLGQSRPITPEVPTAGYVANNVSGYTPAIYAANAAPGGLGQPIPVLTNGTVQNSTGPGTIPQQLPQGSMAGSHPTVVSFSAMPGISQATLQAIPGFHAGLAGLPSMAANGIPAGMSFLPAGATAATPGAAAQMHQLAAYPMFGGAYGQQLIPQQKFAAAAAGQNGLLQPAAASVPVQGMAVPAAAAAQSLKRPIADPYATVGVMDKRLRLA